MVVMIIDNAPIVVRGMLTRWMLEVKPGVFLGDLSKTVRQYIWEKFICRTYDIAGEMVTLDALMAYSFPIENGFLLETTGNPNRNIAEMDGLQLIRTKKNEE